MAVVPHDAKTERIGSLQIDEISYQWVQASPMDGDSTGCVAS
jgi:hypothetical protein